MKGVWKKVQEERQDSHIETHLDCSEHVCNICDQKYKRRNSLQGHKYKVLQENKMKIERSQTESTSDVSLRPSCN